MVAETGMMGTPSSVVPSRTSWTSAVTSSSHSSSTRSRLVTATSPRLTFSRSRMARCSRVWGITDSSAATTSRARSMPPTPASMLLTNRSCPGTSTMLTSPPSERGIQAKPRSMVSPRSFSSWRRSGSMPVRAWTRVDLPWSTCPAVPITCNVSAPDWDASSIAKPDAVRYEVGQSKKRTKTSLLRNLPLSVRRMLPSTVSTSPVG